MPDKDRQTAAADAHDAGVTDVTDATADTTADATADATAGEADKGRPAAASGDTSGTAAEDARGGKDRPAAQIRPTDPAYIYGYMDVYIDTFIYLYIHKFAPLILRTTMHATTLPLPPQTSREGRRSQIMAPA